MRPDPPTLRCPAVLLLPLLLLLAPATAPAQAAAGRADPQPPVPLAKLEGPSGVAVAFSRDGRRLLTAGKDRARVWDAQAFKPVTEPLKHGAAIFSADLSADGTKVLTVGQESAQVWDVRTGRPASPPLRLGRGLPLRSINLSPDGAMVMAVVGEPTVEWKARARAEGVPTEPARGERGVRVWDVASGKMLYALEPHWYVQHAAFSPDGRRVVTVSAGDALSGTARLWDARSGREVMEPLTEVVCVGPRPAAFSADGRRLAVTCFYHVDVLDAESGKKVGSVHGFDNQQMPRTVALSPDGAIVVASATERASRAWSVATGEPVGRTMARDERELDASTFSADGKWLLLATWEPRRVVVWEVATGQKVWSAPAGHMAGPAAFSPDGRRLAVGFAADGWTGVYAVPDGKGE